MGQINANFREQIIRDFLHNYEGEKGYVRTCKYVCFARKVDLLPCNGDYSLEVSR